MDQITSYDPRPKILEDSLTLHPESCPASTIGITVLSREWQAKQVCASGIPEWGLQLQKSDPFAVTHLREVAF